MRVRAISVLAASVPCKQTVVARLFFVSGCSGNGRLVCLIGSDIRRSRPVTNWTLIRGQYVTFAYGQSVRCYAARRADLAAHHPQIVSRLLSLPRSPSRLVEISRANGDCIVASATWESSNRDHTGPTRWSSGVSISISQGPVFHLFIVLGLYSLLTCDTDRWPLAVSE